MKLGHEIVGMAKNGDIAKDLFHSLNPDIVTLDQVMPGNISGTDLVKYINKYLTAMTNVIEEDEGTLDKYVGDEIMAFWGAPMEQKDHAFRACKSAVKQMNALNKLNEELPGREINIGIGLNSGIMTVANVGSDKRMNYTLMGDNVNLGARLEGVNKIYKTNLQTKINYFLHPTIDSNQTAHLHPLFHVQYIHAYAPWLE